MSRFPEFGTRLALAAILSAATAGAALAEPLGLGRPATEEEIAAWDLDIHPDGTGLPPGSGDVWTGDEIFAENCASCHGDFAEGLDNWPKLAGGFDTLDRQDPVKTVGSYWPYLSTAWDYINRSMPFGNAQTLEPDEVYAIVAYILYSNNMVEDDFVLSNENFLDVEMPNADGFIIDDRAETELPLFTVEPCMSDCKDEVKVTMRAAILDVTPNDTTDDGPAGAPEDEDEAAAEAPAGDTQQASAGDALDPALVAAGEKVFRKCKSCHKIGEGARNMTGPQLNGVMGHQMAADPDFRYSKTLKAMGEDGQVWTDEALAAFLTKPRDFVKGTKMSFAGLRDKDDIDAVAEYLRSFAQ